MDLEAERTELNGFLTEQGLPPHSVDLKRRRERSNLWAVQLVGPMGDAVLEVISYQLGERPDLFPDFEDDKAQLRAMSSLSSRASELICDGRTATLGIIVTASPDEAPVARLVRSVILGPRDAVASVAYHPQLDRILGLDFIRQVGTAWAKSSLMPAGRANVLRIAAERLHAATEAHLPELALPRTLAIIAPEWVPVSFRASGERELSIPELLALPEMSLAPPEYHELVQYVAVISEPQTVEGEDGAAVARAALSEFAGRLFAIVGACHRHAQVTFRRGIGCCIRPEMVSPNGHVMDLYFLTTPEEISAATLEHLQAEDVFNAFETVFFVAGAYDTRLAEALQGAAAAYVGRALAAPLLDLVAAAATERSADTRRERVGAVSAELQRRASAP